MSISCRKALSFLMAAGVSACAQTDPLFRDGLWEPSGANHDDLVAMVANPADLIRGHGVAAADGQLAAAAVARLRHDVVKPLPFSGLSEVKLQGDPSPTDAAAAPAAAPTAAAAAPLSP